MSASSDEIVSDKLARLLFNGMDGPAGVGAVGVDGMDGAAVSGPARGVPATSAFVREWNEWGLGYLNCSELYGRLMETFGNWWRQILLRQLRLSWRHWSGFGQPVFLK